MQSAFAANKANSANKYSYFHHITLNTGHDNISPRTQVSEDTVNLVAPWLVRALESGEQVPLIPDKLSHFSLSANSQGGILVCTVWGPYGPHSRGRPHKGEHMPLVTFGMAPKGPLAKQLWDLMVKELGAKPGVKQPSGALCAVAIHPTSFFHLDAMEWFADLERCITWAWFTGKATRNPNSPGQTGSTQGPRPSASWSKNHQPHGRSPQPAPIITISNNGPAIADTNFWDSKLAQRGYFFLSWNAGAGRLLTPDSRRGLISEFRTAKYIILSRGPWPEQGRLDGLELLFEDGTDSPFCLHLSIEQTDRLLSDKEQGHDFSLAVWTRTGEEMRLPCKYRRVNTIPCLEPWEGEASLG